MNGKRFSSHLPAFASLALGIAFCVLLFAYGVTQEVPIGQVEGTVILVETGKPLAHADVSLSVRDDDEAQDHSVTADEHGHFRFKNIKAGEYDITVYAQEHNAKPEHIIVVEGHSVRHDIKLEPNEPYLKMYASQRVWTTDDDPQVELHGFRTGDNIDVEVDRVAFQDLLTAGKFSQAVAALRTEEGAGMPAAFEKYSEKKLEFRHKVKNRDREGAFVEPLTVSNLPAGFYWVKCSGKGIHAATYINVTNIALVTKTARGHALAYVTNLSTGKPVPGATVWSQAIGSKIGKVITDGEGLAETTYASAPDEENSRACIIAVHEGSTGVVGLYTSEDSENSGDATFVLYTERPIYRPGDDVQFKGIVRRRAGSQYLPPLSGKVEIQINDTDDQPIAKFPLDVSSHGTFSGHFSTSKEAGPGDYRLVAKGFGGRGSHFVEMMAYRKPEMSIQVKSLKPYYFYGDKAQVAIQCSYYFGGPVVGAKLKIEVLSSPAAEADPDDESDSPKNSPYEGGEYSKNIDAVTDDKGQAVIQFDTRQSNASNTPLSNTDFSVNVTATDPSKKYVDSTGEVLVVRGSYDLSAESQNYLVSPGDTVDLLVRTTSNDAGHPAAAGRNVTVRASTESWDGNKLNLVSIGDYHATTGSDGVAHVPIKASGRGSIRFKAYSKDDAGRLIVAEDHAYVLGGRWNAEADQSRFEVVLDKRRYKLDENARVMLRTIAPGGSALVTVQTDRVLWKKVVPLTDNTTFVDLPINSDFMPNAFVTVAYVHKKKFYEGNTRFTVDPGNQKLNIKIDSEKTEYLPGGMAQLTVHTSSAKGVPVPAEVSIGVVDESIYAIKEDDFDIFESFYPKRTNSVTTSYSFSEVYLDGGDKGGANVSIRRKFLDTAAWLPAVQTDQSGTATVTVQLPDNLTEWRATAVGVTDDTAVGKSTSKFKARKQLMVRLEMPEFLVQQDDREMTVMITNDTGADHDVHFSLDAKGAGIVGDVRQTVHVAAEKPTALTFRIQTREPGQALLTAKAWIDGGPNDGVEQGFPILAHGTPIRDAWSDEVKDAKDFKITLTPAVDRTTGRLRISVSSSLAGDLVNSLDELIGFPYGCVEQTMSRFMPSILVSKTVHELGIPNLKMESQIPKIANDSMIRLARMQHEDGGWGWWENDKSDPYMTALVLDGFDRCKTAGYPAHKVNLGKALDWCVKRSQSGDWKLDDLKSNCYVVYVLAKYGKTKEATDAYGRLLLRNTSAADRATLILALSALGDSYKVERDRMLDRLTEQAHQGPLGAYWNNSDWDWGSESTALALTAYMTARPTDPIVPRIVRYLMAHRRGNMWDSTRDTAYSLVGLTQYLAATHELAGEMDVKVLVEGREVKQVHLNALNADLQSSTFEIPVSEIHAGSNTVRIERTGTGTCYAALDLQATKVQAHIPASEPIPGYSIERKYYRMEASKLEDGSMMLMPSKKPVTWAESGDIIRVELTIKSNKTRQFVMVEDPTPSNCRVTDREQLDEGEEWSFWWDRLVIRDEKVAFFVRHLREGTQKLTYTMRAEGLGIAHALPTTMGNMYDLAEHTSSPETLLEVK